MSDSGKSFETLDVAVPQRIDRLLMEEDVQGMEQQLIRLGIMADPNKTILRLLRVPLQVLGELVLAIFVAVISIFLTYFIFTSMHMSI